MNPEQTGISQKKSLYILCGLSLLFLAFKWNDLFLPYFWDEMAGYMSGVLYMTDHGISLHPAAIPPELSYGHPLLMHFVLALVGKVFGTSVFVMHLCIWLFTLLLAIATYKLAYEFSKNETVALLSFIIFLFQPIVIAQSSQVVLEVFLSMLCFWSILFYIQKKYILSALFCVLAVLSKETGLVLAIAYPTHLILALLFRRKLHNSGYKWIVFSLPFMAFFVFLFLQKAAHGWYLNPVNMGKTNLSLESMLQKIWDYPIEFTFINQGRYMYSLLILVLILKHFILKKTNRLQIEFNWFLPLIFCFGFVLFSSIADTLERYFILLIPPAVILFAFAIQAFRSTQRYLPVCLLLICLLVQVFYFNNKQRYSETDLSYRDMVKTNQLLINYLNSGRFKNDTVGFSFPLRFAVLDPRYGYYQSLNFNVDSAFLPGTKYRAYCSPGNLDWNPPDTSRLEPLQVFKSNYSKSALYIFRNR